MKYVLAIMALFLIVEIANGYRTPRPSTFSLPWNKNQISQLNEILDQFWNMQNGRFELDVVTTTKTGAKNGEFWFIYTAPVVRLQYKYNGIIYTVTPDGY